MTVLLLSLWPLAAAAEGCPPAPDLAESKDELIAQLRQSGDEATARALMDELWRLWTTAPDAAAQELLDRGMERREAYDWDAAMALFDDLVGYCPDYAEGWNQRAFIHFLRAEYGAALEDLDRALELDPGHIGALSGQALTLMNLGRIEAGQGVLRRALELNPWLPERGMLLPKSEPPGTDL